jgi:CO/xanthine dehydrogenase FAD-binding subunit
MATLGGNIMQRPRCWYFRSSDFDCKKKNGASDDCHAHTGENQYHAIMNNSTCAMVHPSSTAVPLLAMNAQVELTSKRGKRTVAMSDFYVPPEKSLINETVVSRANLLPAFSCPLRSLVHGLPIKNMERRRASIGRLRMLASCSLWTARIAERRGSSLASPLPRLFVPLRLRLC